MRIDSKLTRERKLLGVDLILRGHPVAGIARSLGISRQTVYNWKKATGVPGDRPARMGRRSVIERARIGRFLHALFSRADAAGLSSKGWTSRLLAYAVSSYFEAEFDQHTHFDHHRSHVWRIARALGFKLERGTKDERARLERWFKQSWPSLQHELRKRERERK